MLRLVSRTSHEDVIRVVPIAFPFTRERRRIIRQRKRFHRRTEARYFVLADPCSTRKARRQGLKRAFTVSFNRAAVISPICDSTRLPFASKKSVVGSPREP